METETPSSSPSALDKSGRRIQEMFNGVAPRYDLLNHLLSGYLDVLWRRRAAKVLAPKPGEEVLDLCCGTGDQAAALSRSQARITAADFSVSMLVRARPKLAKSPSHKGSGNSTAPPLAAADALNLPFPDHRFDGAVVSFGIRNVADLDRALSELHRVLKPGGRLVILEFTTPVAPLVRGPFQFYFKHILPRIGRLLSPRGSAYNYLPDSVVEFPQRQAFLDHMGTAGFHQMTWKAVTAGVACIYRGVRPA